MRKIILTVLCCILLLSGCSSKTTKEPAQVTVYTRLNESLDSCVRLGELKTEYEINSDLSQRDNKIKSQDDMKQHAYDEYRADTIVIINSQNVKGSYRQADKIHSRGLAYSCHKDI